MKKTIALVLLVCAGSASASTLRLSSSPFSFGVGGEFTAQPITGNAGLTGLAADLSPGSFQTFCMEHSENFHSGSVYTFVVNTGAIAGSEVSGFDPLDARTAYLYTKFRLGLLTGFDYGAGRQASAGDLQAAIWFIENETGGSNNGFVALANAAVAIGGEWFGVGIGDVRVLNLYDANGGFHQDQLTIIPPIPTPGALALAGAGLIAAGRRRR